MDQEPVTREELKQELGVLKQELGALEERLIQRIEHSQTELEERLTERMRDMQTEIIRVFMDFQQRNESRDGFQSKTSAALDERLLLVERRLFEIEKKLLLEPPAAA